MFSDYDSVIKHLAELMRQQSDGFISSRYTGFVAVSAITVYEVEVKKLFFEFASRINPILGNYVSSTMGQLSARVQREDLEKYLSNFDEGYTERFKSLLNQKEEECLRSQRDSVKNAYANLFRWRHEFVHGGKLPQHATFSEVVKAYDLGKEVVFALRDVLAAEQCV